MCPTPACSPMVVSRWACRRSDALQRIFTATAWLCSQLDGSFRSAAHETRVELYRQRLLAEIAHGACDLTGQYLRHSLLPRRRDLSELARLIQAWPLVFLRDCQMSLLLIELTCWVVLWTPSLIRSSKRCTLSWFFLQIWSPDRAHEDSF